MMNSSTMSDMLRDMMMQREERASEPEMIMPGEAASPVMYEAETGRAYVIYEDEEGGRNKVFGNWEMFIAGQDDLGNEMIAPEQYPVSRDEAGDLVLDEEALEDMMAQQQMEEEQMAQQQMMQEQMPQQGMGGMPMQFME